MLERGISALGSEPTGPESAAEARTRLQSLFPRAALRRMSHLGMLVGSVLKDWTADPADAVYYVTANAEARALEDYLKSFPAASPLGFQTSVHPSAVQQVMIGRQQPLGRFVPMAGETMILEQALLAVLADPAERVVLVGGEERGSWLTEAGAASAESFAFSLTLQRGPGAVGTLQLDPTVHGPIALPPTLKAFAQSLAQKHALTWQSGSGLFSLAWR